MSLHRLSVTEISAGLAAKKFTSLEVTNDCLNAINAAQDLNAFLTICDDSARKDASAADKLRASGDSRPLLGIPIAIKDVLSTKGIKTTCGSKILSNYIPPYDATVIRKLRDAGTVIVGKTNMDEFAMGSSTENSAFGPVKNPWKKDRVPGGSSGGSAAAVAAPLVPVALGTDTGGSIRQPAAFCNLVGLKPTYGRVSRYGLIAFASSLDQIGTFTRTVRDCAVVAEILSGRDAHDSTSVAQPVPHLVDGLSTSLKGLKLGVPKEYFIGGLSPEVNKAIKASLKQFEALGASIIDVTLPHTEAAVAVYYIIAPAEASSNLARFDGIRYGYRAKDSADLHDLYFKTRSEGFGPEVQRRILIGAYVLSAGYYDAYYLRAQKIRALIANDFRNAFSQCDLIVCPTAPTTAFKLGEKTSDPLAMYLNDVFTIPTSLAGLPAMSLPCGFDKESLPIGLQLIGKAWDEMTLIKAASAYEASTDWHKRLPTE